MTPIFVPCRLRRVSEFMLRRHSPSTAPSVASMIIPERVTLRRMVLFWSSGSRALRPTAVNPECISFSKCQLARRLANASPKGVEPIRHTFWLNCSFKNFAADTSSHHPTHVLTLRNRSAAYKPSWMERCTNSYCAACLADLAATSLSNGKGFSSLTSVFHSVCSSGVSVKHAPASIVEISRRLAIWLAMARVLMRSLAASWLPSLRAAAAVAS